MAFVRAGGYPPFERIGPIQKIPPRHGTQHSGSIKVPFVPLQHTAYAREKTLHKGWIVTQHPVIVDHRHPPEREWRYVLSGVRGIARAGQAFRAARRVEELNGVAHEPVIACVV